MGAIFGMVQSDGPVEPDNLRQMSRALRYWDADGDDIWCCAEAGLGSRFQHILPEDRFEIQPLVQDGRTLVGIARLSNRQALESQLGLTGGKEALIAASQLILNAYLKWGTDCPHRLRGDWVFAVWDDRAKSLFIARSPSCNRNVYYFFHNAVFVFSTSLKALLALPNVPQQPNPLWVMNFLFPVMTRGNGQFAYKNFYCLPKGHWLQLGANRPRISRFWYPENLSPIYYPNGQDYYDRFVEIYRRAVADSLRTPHAVGVALSSGLDSASVASLAAPLLHDQGKPLHTFTSAPFYPVSNYGNRITDEWPLARQLSKAHINIRSSRVEAADAELTDSLRRTIFALDRPVTMANRYWLFALLQAAREGGIRVLLTGQGGNGTVSYAGSGSLWPLLIQRQWRAVTAVFRNSPWPIWEVFHREVARPVINPLSQALRKIHRVWTYNYDTSFIHPDFMAAFRSDKRLRQECLEDLLHLYTRTRDGLFDFRTHLMREFGAPWNDMGLPYNIRVEDPTLAQEVIEYCLQIPDRIQWRHGQEKGLIRHGFKNLMPADILNAAKRGVQAGDISFRVAKQQDRLVELIEDLSGHSLASSWLDLEKMRQALYKANRAPDAKMARRLLNALGIGLFLKRF